MRAVVYDRGDPRVWPAPPVPPDPAVLGLPLEDGHVGEGVRGQALLDRGDVGGKVLHKVLNVLLLREFYGINACENLSCVVGMFNRLDKNWKSFCGNLVLEE